MYPQLGSGGPPPGSSRVAHTAGGLQDLGPLTRPLSVGCSVSHPQPQPGRTWFCLRSTRSFQPTDIYYVSGTEASRRPSKKKKKRLSGKVILMKNWPFLCPASASPGGSACVLTCRGKGRPGSPTVQEAGAALIPRIVHLIGNGL